MTTEKEMLSKDLDSREEKKDIEQFIEDTELLGGHEDLVARAREKISNLESMTEKMTQPVEETASEKAQVEKLGGSETASQEVTAPVDEKIAEEDVEIKNVGAEYKKKIEAAESELAVSDSEDQSAFEKRESFTAEQKAYADQMNRVKEKMAEKDKQFQKNRGLIAINDQESIAIEEFVKDPKNIDTLNFKNIYNTSNIDLLLENGVPPEKIYGRLKEGLGESRTIEKIMLLPKNAKEKMYAAINDNKNLKEGAKKLGDYYAERSQISGDAEKFTAMIKLVGLPLNHQERNDIYPNYVAKAKEVKTLFENKLNTEMERGGVPIDLSVLCRKPEELSALFQASERKYISREEAVKFAQAAIMDAFNEKNQNNQQQIQESVLTLQKAGQISEEEVDQILNAPLS